MLRFITDLLSQAAVLIALVVLVGQISQRKSFAETVSGTMKSFIGFILIGAGAGVLVGALGPFGDMFQVGFNVQGVVPNNEAIIALTLEKYGAQSSIVMVVGFAFHLVIARFTPLKAIFLTGHHTLYMAVLMTAVLIAAGASGWMLFVLGGISVALTLSLSPYLSKWAMPYIVKDANIAMGHLSSITYSASAFIGKIAGKGSKSTEDMKLPKYLTFMRDNILAIAITMTILYVVVAVAAGKAYVESELSNGLHYIVFAIIQASTFAAGVYIVLSGVRFILAELVPAFKGISEKLIPNAVPALDCPIVFPFAPNAVLIGFLSSFIGGIVGLVVLDIAGGTLILPGVVPHFFVGATAGVFGNATGGRRGCVLGAFVNGLLITFLPLVLMPLLGDFGFANTTFSDGDFILFGTVFGYIIKLFGL